MYTLNPNIICKDLKILSIKNFYNVNPLIKRKINFCLEDNYIKYYGFYVGGNYVSGNYPIIEKNHLFFEDIKNKYLKICKKIFGEFSEIRYDESNIWCYRSELNNNASYYHNHIKSSVINGVYYYQINSGDSISFLGKDLSEIKYYPKIGELLIFPSYVYHKPNKTEKNKIRYSFNMEIVTKEDVNDIFKVI